METDQQRQALDGIFGPQTAPAPSPANGVPSLADTIRSIGKQNSAAAPAPGSNGVQAPGANLPKSGIAQGISDFLPNTISAIQKRGETLANNTENTSQNIENAGGGIGAKVLGGIEVGGDIAGQTLGGLGDVLGNAISPFLNPAIKKSMGDVSGKISSAIDQIPGMTAELKGKIADAFTGATLAVGDNLAPAAASTVSDAASGAVDTASDLVKSAKSAVVGSPEANATVSAADDLQAIKDTISPKPTIKEAKLATQEGRLYKGSDPTLLKSGTEDSVATSDQQYSSVRTIKRLIPDASTMDEPTLYSALDEKVGTLGKQLQPKLEAAPVSDETFNSINDKWNELKKTQMDEAKATDEPNVKKWQDNFQKFLDKSKLDNMNDLWNSAKDYDTSIKDNVKNATENSSEDLQVQKDIWLQNRAVLRDALKNSEGTLGKETASAFSDMRDMYEAQNGIMSKAKIEGGGEPSKLSQAYNSPTGKTIRTVAKVGVGLEAGKKLLGL